MKISKNDNVLVISGKYKGKTGRVEKIFPKIGKIIVSGVNIAKKSTKPSKKNPKGGISDIAMPIDISNLKLICPKCQKAVRVGYKIVQNKKTRYCKKCSEQIQWG